MTIVRDALDCLDRVRRGEVRDLEAPRALASALRASLAASRLDAAVARALGEAFDVQRRYQVRVRAQMLVEALERVGGEPGPISPEVLRHRVAALYDACNRIAGARRAGSRDT